MGAATQTPLRLHSFQHRLKHGPSQDPPHDPKCTSQHQRAHRNQSASRSWEPQAFLLATDFLHFIQWFERVFRSITSGQTSRDGRALIERVWLGSVQLQNRGWRRKSRRWILPSGQRKNTKQQPVARNDQTRPRLCITALKYGASARYSYFAAR